MSAINDFLLKHNLRIAQNPCVSPDFCLDWAALQKTFADSSATGLVFHPKSTFETAAGTWTLVEQAATGDCAWRLESKTLSDPSKVLAEGVFNKPGRAAFPASWANLLKLKNLIQEHDAASTIFPTGTAQLGRSTLGVGARFTTLHWPAVEWAMSALEVGLTANQNSIPRELVYDVDAMLGNRLDTVPFPFIGTNVPEGHQGQSVEGMSHGCVLSKLKTGFHHRKIAWSFNADHQPIGGKFDVREDALVKGCLLASYITFDLSPELALNQPAKVADIPAGVVTKVRDRVGAALLSAAALAKADATARGRAQGAPLQEEAFTKLLGSVWPSLQKMKRRDEKYAAARAAAFTTPVGRTYLRELSIDELPGLTTPETTAIMLALCEVLGMPVNFVAPAFGFQKNTPYPDNAALKQLIEAQWGVCRQFGVSIGFHSGSGKSAENYQVMGSVTGSALEIKTSGRYTYEMGVAISQSKNPADAALWRDWYKFTVDMSVAGAFSADATEQKMARIFVTTSLENHAVGASLLSAAALAKADDDARGRAQGAPLQNVFASPASCRAALEALPPSAEHMIFFEYNFLYVLAAGGKPEKSALGDHTAAGYQQRARFYAVSAETRLLFSKRIAAYLIFLAENTGLATRERCAATSKLLASYTTLDAMLNDISR